MRYVCADCTKPGAKKVFRTRTLPVDCAECQRMVQIYHSDDGGGFEADSSPESSPQSGPEAPTRPDPHEAASEPETDPHEAA